MKLRSTVLIVILFVFVLQGSALPLKLSDPKNHPPRTIRVCCMFGSKVGIAVLPFIKLTAVTSIDKIGSHHYLGRNSENNGIIYTWNGGFIDMGHLRDVADWTAYLYSMMKLERYQECIQMDLGYEGGEKKIFISVPPGLSDDDLILLAGRIAYDLSVWHEIATWFGVCSVPLVSEQFSSFSVEDGYSNLLGALLGIKAIQSELPFEEAMTRLIREKLNELEVVSTTQETLQAMEAVVDKWWTREAHMPSNRVQIARLVTLYDTVYPKLIPDYGLVVHHPQPAIIPYVTSAGDSLSYFYDLSIKLNHKFPVKDLFPDSSRNTITQRQFGILTNEIDKELQTGFLTKSRAELAAIRKNEKSEHKKPKKTDN
jgi:hypothetical protein